MLPFLFMSKNNLSPHLNLSLKDMPNEEWKPIPGYEGIYEVSNMGRIKSFPKPSNGRKIIILKNIVCCYGYYHVNLHKEGISTRKRIHRIVGLSFLENPLNLPEVNHKKGKKWDNRAGELEWSTQQDNITHAIETGLSKVYGEDSCKSLLTNEQAIEIFNSEKPSKELSKKYGVDSNVINCIRSGKTYSIATGKIYVQSYSKMSTDQVMSIFNAVGPLKEIAALFKTNEYSVRCIKNGKKFSSITGKLYDPIKITKLTTDQVIEIFRSTLKHQELSKIYGVTQSNISSIKSGSRHKNITASLV